MRWVCTCALRMMSLSKKSFPYLQACLTVAGLWTATIRYTEPRQRQAAAVWPVWVWVAAGRRSRVLSRRLWPAVGGLVLVEISAALIASLAIADAMVRTAHCCL